MIVQEETKSLLIYIPSYNRYERLCEQLDIIVPNLSKYKLSVYISNNASTDQRYSNLSTQYIHEKLFIITNNVNIGGNANIFNGFLQSPPYDYLWILSDDDALNDNSIDIIMNLIEGSNDLIYLTDRNTNINKEEYNLKDILEILNYGLGLISCVVYRTKTIQDELYRGYEYISSGFPHLAIIFFACNRKETLKILQYPADKILDLKRTEPPSTDNAIPYSLYGSVHLADFITDKSMKNNFIKWIIYGNIWNIMRYRKKNQLRYNDLVGYIFAQSLMLYSYFYVYKLSYYVKKLIYDVFSHINGGRELLVYLDSIFRYRKKWMLFPKKNK